MPRRLKLLLLENGIFSENLVYCRSSQPLSNGKTMGDRGLACVFLREFRVLSGTQSLWRQMLSLHFLTGQAALLISLSLPVEPLF